MDDRATILIVDDDQEILQLFAAVLQKAGYSVMQTKWPEEAVSICATSKAVDLVVSDVLMPGLDGARMAGNIRKLRPNLEFIFVSASPWAFQDLESQGFVCLEKPVQFAQLLQAIQSRLKPTHQRIAGSRTDEG